MSDTSKPRNGWIDRYGEFHRYVDHDGNVIQPGTTWYTPIDLRPIMEDDEARRRES
jgi:hypothetical protein